MQTTMKATNRVKVWRVPDLHDAELLKGNYARHAYPWHSHEELSLGLVLGGAIQLRTRLAEGVAKAGSFVLINFDEIHQGSPAVTDGWQCRTIHLLPSAVRCVAEEITDRPMPELPRFDWPTFDDPRLSNEFLALHRPAESNSCVLERQSRICVIIARLLRQHSSAPAMVEMTDGAEPRARQYLDDHLSDKVTLEDLSVVAGLPPFRLLRAFQKSLGVTPHSYQLQARVRRAHEFLSGGEAIADVSFAVGFSDQAHLTRTYKSIMGATPGQFKTAVLAI